MCDPWLSILAGLLGGLVASGVMGWRSITDLRAFRRRLDEYAKLRALAEHIAEHPESYAALPIYRLASDAAAMPREGLR